MSTQRKPHPLVDAPEPNLLEQTFDVCEALGYGDKLLAAYFAHHVNRLAVLVGLVISDQPLGLGLLLLGRSRGCRLLRRE